MFKRRENRSILLFLIFIMTAGFTLTAAETEVSLFNAGWSFDRYGEMPDGSWRDEPSIRLKKWIPLETPQLATEAFDDSDWRKLDLPHDWGIEGPFRMDLPGNTGKLPWAGIGWYRKRFTLPEGSAERRWFVEFDGVMSNSLVWVNGHFLGFRPYGYSSFAYELTPWLKPDGENVIAVRARPEKDSSRWYPGAGIYRDVRLVSTEKVRISQWGLFVTTPEVNKDKAIVSASIELNGAAENASYQLSGRVLTAGGSVVAECPAVEFFGSEKASLKAVVSNPELWDVENPALYQLEVTLESGGSQLDRRTENFGIRTFKWTADDGFHLNGRRVEIKGVCNHHDLGALGGAYYSDAARRQLELLKEMGFNSLRTAHNPPAPDLLDLCDEMGILVQDESFDCWEVSKRKNDYGKFFKEWHERDVRDLVRRDRNHPSVVSWSAGNEIIDFWYKSSRRWSNTLKRLMRFFNEEDPTRPVAIGCNFDSYTTRKRLQDNIDIIGYNYQTHYYAKGHQEMPDKPLLGSETSSCLSTRGEYLFPVDEDKGKGMFNFQMSSYDLYAPPWGSTPDYEFKGLDENRHIAGEYVWTGFDYLGEPTPYNNDMTIVLNTQDPAKKAELEAQLKKYGEGTPSRSSYFGILDLAGFPKDRFYSYQARWKADTPVAHLFPHWNWSGREGEITPVHLYTSGDEAELFVNGVSQGRKKLVKGEYRFRWDDVIYQPGSIEAKVWKNGKVWAEDRVETTGKASAIRLIAEKTSNNAGAGALLFLRAEVTDAQGRMVPAAMNRIRFSVEGAGELLALCNGDPTSFEPFQADNMKAFNGLLQAIILNKDSRAGSVTVLAESDGLATDSVTVTFK